MACIAAPAFAVAQPCTRVESRTSLPGFVGERVSSVDIAADGPLGRDPSALLARFDRLHVRTSEHAIRRQLLIVAGRPLDSLEVKESLRRLRRLRILKDVALVAERCEGRDGVAIIVATRDAWSMHPDARLTPASQSSGAPEPAGVRLPNGTLGVEEVNVLGTGRELRLSLESRDARVGLGGAVTDPALFGQPVIARLRVARLPNDRTVAFSARSDARDVSTDWRTDVLAVQSTRWPMRADDAFARTALRAYAGRRVSPADAPSAVFASLGAEHELARLSRPDGMRALGPSRVARDFTGLALGLERIAARYDQATWLLPRDGVLDVPRGVELSGTLAVGREWVRGDGAAHGDVWAGRVWMPARYALVSTDVWGSGYVVGRDVNGGVLRAASVLVARAPHGTWTARVAGERLVAPDPDVRPLMALDPTASMIDASSRTATTVLAASAERARHVDVGARKSLFDVAAFGAASLRRSSAALGHPEMTAAAVGVGLRTVPATAGHAALRLDWLVPVAASPGVRRRPYVTVGFSPAFGTERYRDGQRPR